MFAKLSMEEVWHGSEYFLGSQRARVLNTPLVLNMLEFTHGPEYGWVISEYARIYLNMSIVASIFFPPLKNGIKSQLRPFLFPPEKWKKKKKSSPLFSSFSHLDFEINSSPGASGTISALKMSQMVEILIQYLHIIILLCNSYYLFSMISRSITYWVYCLSLLCKCYSNAEH